jgi:medium-chain acyl-[acyl-carrier-protein] hydrolase
MLNGQISGSWLVWPERKAQPRLRIFCFPYAGGAASAYRAWPGFLPDEIEVVAVQLPGRENRIRDARSTNVTATVRTLAAVLSPYLQLPFAFYGHSMGALLAFEVARQLRTEMERVPVHLFVGARRAPAVPARSAGVHDLPDAEFLEAIRRLGGVPQEILQSQGTMRFFLPLWRDDFALAASYTYRSEPPFACPITAFGGILDDEVPLADLKAWRSETSASFVLHTLPADHFFLRSHTSDLLHLIARELGTQIPQSAGRSSE